MHIVKSIYTKIISPIKVFLFTLLMFGICPDTWGQSLFLSDSTNQYENNDTIIMYGGDVSIDVHLNITNKSQNTLNVLLRKTIFAVMPGSMNYYCWGICYPNDTLQSTYPVMIHAQQTDFLNFTGHYLCQGNPGTAFIRYTFFDQQNPSDSVCINVEYHACLTSDTEIEEPSEANFSVFPNPAQHQLTLSYALQSELQDAAYVEIKDLSGATVVYRRLDCSRGEQTFGFPDLKAGLYICLLYHNNSIQAVRKLIIR